jgi:hypothetical protein
MDLQVIPGCVDIVEFGNDRTTVCEGTSQSDSNDPIYKATLLCSPLRPDWL